MKLCRSILAVLGACALFPADTGAKGTPGKTAVMSIPKIVPNPNEQIARDAYREVSRAQSAVARALAESQREYEASSDFRDAVNSARQARAELERLRISTARRLQETTQYKAAQIELWKSQQQLEELRAGQFYGAVITDAAASVLRKRAVLTAMEAEVLENDEQLRTATYAAIDAEAKVTAMRQSFVETVRNNSRFQTAKSQLDNARARMDSIGR